MGARQGRARFVSRQAQLVGGVRAGPGFPVGYLGSPATLTTLNVGDPAPAGWSAAWDSGTLVVGGDDVEVDHYRINASVVFTGDNPTVTNCVIVCNPLDSLGCAQISENSGYFRISDTTVVGQPNIATSHTQASGIRSDSGLIAVRCDVSGTGDGIHLLAQPTTPSRVSQCYVHDQAFIDEEQHCDGIQVFNHPTLPAAFTVEHTYVARTTSTIGTPLSAAFTCGPPSNNSEPLVTPTVTNNFFESGLYHLRLNFRLQNCVVTDNDFGPIHASETGEVSTEGSSIATWSNNRDSDGDLIASP